MMNMDSLIFTNATLKDAERAAALFGIGKELDSQIAINLFKGEFLACERLPDQRTYFLANSGDALVAYAGVRFYNQDQDENMYSTTQLLPTGWYLRGLKFHPDWRRMGVAREITNRRLEWLKKRAETIFVFLNDDTKETIPMYHELGFKEVSRGWSFLSSEWKREGQMGILLSLEF
jgi:GNAT superfamily N-acetyltransferase